MRVIDVNELNGDALLYSLYLGLMPSICADDVMPNGIPYWVKVHMAGERLPTEDWGSCGDLVESEGVTLGLNINPDAPKWMAVAYDGPLKRIGLSDSPKVAVCRAIVASKLGDTIEIPDEVANE